jgi:predicted FMN-binding regulatory protein PaiB
MSARTGSQPVRAESVTHVSGINLPEHATPSFVRSTRDLFFTLRFEVVPERIVVKSKLSPNKDDRDRINAAEELQKRVEREVSAAMLAAKN